MKNRERLQSIAMYDLLLRIANNTESCILRLITGQMPRFERCNREKCCAACLQKWMNEEETPWKN